MSSFDVTCEIGDRVVEMVAPLLRARAVDGHVTFLSDDPTTSDKQRYLGDAVLTTTDGRIITVEIKGEQENKHGNLFLETWSNRQKLIRGWLETSRCNVLVYSFLDERTAYTCFMSRLQGWALKEGHVGRYPERKQQAYEQHNDTWGRPVPIAHLRKTVGLKRFELGAEGDEVQREMFG